MGAGGVIGPSCGVAVDGVITATGVAVVRLGQLKGWVAISTLLSLKPDDHMVWID